MFDYTPKARRKPRRWRRLMSALVFVLAIAGTGALLAANRPADTAGGPSPDLAGGLVSAAPDGSIEPVVTPRPTPTPEPTPTLVPAAPPVWTLTGYQWPLPNGRLTLPFGQTAWGSKLVDGELFHDAIDLATFCGDKVVAAHDGVVLAASRKYDDYMGWLGDLTPYKTRLDEEKLWTTLPIVVVIDDGNGYRSIYAHFSKVVVKKGQVVKAGEFLGYEGMTGRASGCHVHYGLFSPLETATFGIDPDVVKRMLLPDTLIARIDPLLVLPPRPQDQPSAPPVPGAPSPNAVPEPLD